jgi:DNA-binding IclR family transcriptional regulator
MKSVDRAIDAIHYLQEHPGASLGDIAEHLRVHKSSASRLLRGFEQRGWVARDDSGLAYRIGPAFLSIGRSAVEQFLPAGSLLSMMEALRDASGETVHLALFEHNIMLHVLRVDSRDVIHVSCPAGTRDAMHSTALGKAFLAALPDEAARRLVGELKLERRTPNTITESRALLAEIEATRARGYSIDHEEGRIGVRCVGIALVDAGARPVGALSITGPAFRWTARAMDRVIEELLAIADRGMREAGYRGVRARPRAAAKRA